jgi:hypothetical protein
MQSIAHGVWSNVLSALSVEGPIRVIIFKVSVVQKTPTGLPIFCGGGSKLAKGALTPLTAMSVLGHIPCGERWGALIGVGTESFWTISLRIM